MPDVRKATIEIRSARPRHALEGVGLACAVMLARRGEIVRVEDKHGVGFPAEFDIAAEHSTVVIRVRQEDDDAP